MNKQEYIESISKQRKIQKVLNDIYIWARFAIFSLKETEANEEAINAIPEFSVPSKVKEKKVTRKSEDILASIHKAHTTEIYKALIVYIVSLVEPVLLEVVRLTLLFDKRRLKTKPKGAERQLDYDTIIDSDNYDSVINVIISKYIDALSYSKPQEQLEYLTKLLSITINEDVWNKWIEIKATRDLIVHNSCIINRVYLDKVGASARGSLGNEIIINEDYYKEVIIVCKSITGQIVSRVVKNIH